MANPWGLPPPMVRPPPPPLPAPYAAATAATARIIVPAPPPPVTQTQVASAALPPPAPPAPPPFRPRPPVPPKPQRAAAVGDTAGLPPVPAAGLPPPLIVIAGGTSGVHAPKAPAPSVPVAMLPPPLPVPAPRRAAPLPPPPLAGDETGRRDHSGSNGDHDNHDDDDAPPPGAFVEEPVAVWATPAAPAAVTEMAPDSAPPGDVGGWGAWYYANDTTDSPAAATAAPGADPHAIPMVHMPSWSPSSSPYLPGSLSAASLLHGSRGPVSAGGSGHDRHGQAPTATASHKAAPATLWARMDAWLDAGPPGWRGRRRLWLLTGALVLVVLLIIIIAVAASASARGSTPPSSSNSVLTGNTTTPSATPTAATPTTAVPTVPGPSTAVPTTPIPGPRTRPIDRAMWVWTYDGCFFNTYPAGNYVGNCGYGNWSSYMNAFFTVLHAPWSGAYPGYTRLFWSIPLNTIANKAANLRQGLRRAHDEGVAIEFLDVGSSWVTSASGVATGISVCQAIAWFNGNATDPRDVFDGVHLDIEPHTLGPAWFQNTGAGQDRYNDAYQANLIAIFRGCMALFVGTNTTVAWDVPDDYYYYVTDLWRPLVQDPYVDYLSVMNYDNSTARLMNGVNGIGGVSNVLLSLAGSGVPAMFGVEIQPPPNADNTISYWPQGLAPMEAALATLNATYASNPLFLGNIVHLLETYRALPAGGAGSTSFCANMGRVLYAYSNSTSVLSMRVYSATNGSQLSVNDVSGYIPGPWSMPLFNDGPYRIELYDAVNGQKASPSSPVPSAVCTVLLP